MNDNQKCNDLLKPVLASRNEDRLAANTDEKLKQDLQYEIYKKIHNLFLNDYKSLHFLASPEDVVDYLKKSEYLAYRIKRCAKKLFKKVDAENYAEEDLAEATSLLAVADPNANWFILPDSDELPVDPFIAEKEVQRIASWFLKKHFGSGDGFPFQIENIQRHGFVWRLIHQWHQGAHGEEMKNAGTGGTYCCYCYENPKLSQEKREIVHHRIKLHLAEVCPEMTGFPWKMMAAEGKAEARGVTKLCWDRVDAGVGEGKKFDEVVAEDDDDEEEEKAAPEAEWGSYGRLNPLFYDSKDRMDGTPCKGRGRK